MSNPWGYVIGGLDGRVMFVTKITDRQETLYFQSGAAIITRISESGSEPEHVFAVGSGQWKYARPIHADENTPLKEWCAAFDETLR